MWIPKLLTGGLALLSSSSPSASPDQEYGHRETLAEAAVNAKKLVHEYSTGTMASVFSNDSPNAGRPFAMMEYHAPCHIGASLTFILMPISLSTRNILSSEGHHATYTVQTPTNGIAVPFSQGRVALIGNITTLPVTSLSEEESSHLKSCYLHYHPDAKWWLPGSSHGAHVSEWARFDVQDIYYVGGFGDTHYIGHIPVDMYAEAKPPHDKLLL